MTSTSFIYGYYTGELYTEFFYRLNKSKLEQCTEDGVKTIL